MDAVVSIKVREANAGGGRSTSLFDYSAMAAISMTGLCAVKDSHARGQQPCPDGNEHPGNVVV